MSSSYRGEWWPPDAPKPPWNGTLAHVEGRLELDVDLPTNADEPFLSVDERPIILGQARDRTHITLVDCQPRQTTNYLPGRASAIFRPRLAVIGAWFEKRDELTFEAVDVRFQHLERWVDATGFSFDYAGPSVGFDLSYRIPDSVELLDTPQLTITAEFSAKGPSITRPLVDVHATQATRLRLQPAAELHLDEHEETVRRIRNFLSFSVRQDAPLLDLNGLTDVEARTPDGEISIRPRWLEIVPGDSPDAATGEEDRPMLLMAGDLTRTGESPLGNWLNHYDRIGPIFELYLVTLYQPRTYLHLQFLSLAQALESLHGRKFPDWEMPRPDFTAKVAGILEAHDALTQDWLREKLRHANQASFRKRVEELVATLPPVLRLEIPDADAFGRLVGFTRNYYTHWDQRLEDKAAKDEELFRLTFSLKLIVEALLLIEIGFDADEVELILTRHPRLASERHHFMRPPLGRSTRGER